jgi:hypothetical protein
VEHFDGHAKLALAAIDDQQIGQQRKAVVGLLGLRGRVGHDLGALAADHAFLDQALRLLPAPEAPLERLLH